MFKLLRRSVKILFPTIPYKGCHCLAHKLSFVSFVSFVFLCIIDAIQECDLLVPKLNYPLVPQELLLKLSIFDAVIFDLLLRDIRVFVIILVIAQECLMGFSLAVLLEL